MPAVLDTPKTISKQEEFVEKQIQHARQRIRVLDWFAAGLVLLIGSLAFLFTVLIVDRYVETPAGAGWAALGLYILTAAGYVYLALYHPSRRQINPFYAAHQVERTIADAKNSVVNYVDLKDDATVPGSVKAAIGVRAAKDLKHVDLNQVLQKRQILWLAISAGVFLIASSVAFFLPPTRTSLALRSPKEGHITILQGEDLRLEVELNGRIPAKTEPDHARVRLWYNPDDPATYEERLLEPVEGQRRLHALTVPAKQVRNGLHYKLMAGNAQSPDYEVKVRIIPQFTAWAVEYAYPEYKKLEPRKTEDPNLVGYYNTMITLTAFTNRPVKSGTITIEGQVEDIAGTLIDDNPEAIRFRFPMLRNSHYRIRFVTTDGDTNRDPQRYRMALIDPKPLFLNYDVTFDYPKYLRTPSETVTRKEPHLEAMRGTKVTLLAHANRPVKDATIQFPGYDKEAKIQFPGYDETVIGKIDPKMPMDVKFTLPPLTKDGAYRVVFAPTTNEGQSEPRVFNVRVISDEKPRVVITKPAPELVEIPASGVLDVEGEATDDIGVAKMILHMELVSPAPSKPLADKPYRKDDSFRREADGSYPTKIEYKDFVELAKVRATGVAGDGFRLEEGMVVEYWLEAKDNCDVPPGPNSGYSEPHKRLRITAPIEKKKDQQQREQQQRQQEQQKHEQQQDQKNANEKREPKQQPQQGDQPQQQQGGGGEQQGEPQKKDGPPPKGGGKASGTDTEPMPNDQQPPDDPNLQKQKDQVQQALNKANPEKDGKGADTQPGDQPKTDNPKNDVPKDTQPKTDIPKDKDGPKKDAPKSEPKNKEGMGSDTQPNELPKPENFKDIADKLKSDDPKTREEAREQLQRSMEQAKMNPSKPENQQKQIEEHRDNLDEKQKQEFDQAMKDIQKEMDNLKREDRVKEAAEKAKSDDPKTREEGQKEIERELQNQNTRDDVDRQLQQLANDTKDKERKKKLDDATNLSRNNVKKQDQKADPQSPKKGEDTEPQPKKDDNAQAQPPKKDEEDVDRLAKKIKNGTEQEKKDAQEKLENKLNDPKQHDQVQKQLDDIRNNIKDEQERKNFDESMKQVKDNVAKKDPKNQPPTPKAEDIQKFADKLTSEKKEEREQAQKQLEDALKQADKDPNAREQAQKQIKDIRDGIKDDKKKEQFDQAMQKIDKAVDQHRQDQQAKADQQRKDEVGKAANDLNSKDPEKQQVAKQKLDDMLKDPKTKDAAKKELDDIKQNAKDQATKDNIDQAVKNAEQNSPGKKGGEPKKEDIPKLANDLNSKDPDKQQAAKQKLDDMLKDPKTKDAVKKELDDIKQNAKDQTTKDNIDNAMKKADENATGKKGGEPKKEDIDKLANDLNSKDTHKRQAAQKKLDDMLKDPKTKDAAKQELDDIKQNAKDQATKDNIDQALQNAKQDAKGEPKKDHTAKMDPKDAEKLLKQLQSMDPKDLKEAERKLDEIMKDPAKRAALEKQLEQLKDNLKNDLKDDQARKDLEKKLNDLRDQLAKKDGKEPGKTNGDLTKHDGKTPGNNPTEEAPPGSLPDLKNQAKAGELLLEKFKRNIDNEEFKKELGWNDARMKEFQAKYAKQLAALKHQIDAVEKGDLPMPREKGPSSLTQGPERINLDPKENGSTNAGGKFIAPPGFADPYRHFTDEVSGNRLPNAKK